MLSTLYDVGKTRLSCKNTHEYRVCHLAQYDTRRSPVVNSRRVFWKENLEYLLQIHKDQQKTHSCQHSENNTHKSNAPAY